MRMLARIAVLALLAAGLSSLAATAAAAPKLPELPVSQLLTSTGVMGKLRAGATYQASQFPLALRLTPPDGSWSGAQWTSGRLPAELAERLHVRDEGGPPHYGWAAVARGLTSPSGFPRGLIAVMTAHARTPSVAATVTVLLTHGHGATYEPTTPVKIAGFSGVQFDGQLIPTAPHHIFVPFDPSHRGFPSKLDAIPIYGPVFRMIVLDVRGKTVVVCIDSVTLTAEEFPAFLTQADAILKTLRFPS